MNKFDKDFFQIICYLNQFQFTEKYAINQTLISLVAVKIKQIIQKVKWGQEKVGRTIYIKLAILYYINFENLSKWNKDKKGIADAIEKASKKPLTIIKIIIKKSWRFLFKDK